MTNICKNSANILNFRETRKMILFELKKVVFKSWEVKK